MYLLFTDRRFLLFIVVFRSLKVEQQKHVVGRSYSSPSESYTICNSRQNVEITSILRKVTFIILGVEFCGTICYSPTPSLIIVHRVFHVFILLRSQSIKLRIHFIKSRDRKRWTDVRGVRSKTEDQMTEVSLGVIDTFRRSMLLFGFDFFFY